MLLALYTRYMKKILPILLFIFLVIAPCSVKAAEFELTDIGASSTTGKSFSRWTYYGVNPEFSGTAASGAQVAITVDETEYTTNADTDGSWTWQPTTLTEGSYQITVSSGSESKSFTLNISSAEDWNGSTATSTAATTATSGADTLPETGSFDQTVLLLMFGFSLLGLGVGSKLLLASVESE